MNPQSTASLIAECLRARPTAVVGASADRSKYGNIVLRHLRDHGGDVFAVNPKGGQIEGEPAYPSLADCPRNPALAVLVTPPEVSLRVLTDAAAAGVERIWFQQGAESPEALDRARELGLKTVHDACIMVQMALFERRPPTEDA